MKSIKSFWGQMHQKWFGPKVKEGDKKNAKKTNSASNVPQTSATESALPTNSR